MVDLGDRLRLVASSVEVVPPDQPLTRLPVARAVWVPAPDLSTAAQAWLTAGGPHHTVLTTAVDFESLADVAPFAGIELLLIDEHTTPAAFADAIRRNAAYY